MNPNGTAILLTYDLCRHRRRRHYTTILYISPSKYDLLAADDRSEGGGMMILGAGAVGR